MDPAKTSQLQIRITPAQKHELQRRAYQAGLSLSAWALAQLLPKAQTQFQSLTHELASADAGAESFALAALHDYLAREPDATLVKATAEAPNAKLSPFAYAYLAAMVEYTLVGRRIPLPTWVQHAGALDEPYFASSLLGLRVHLLTTSPAAFRRRNLFVDATVGSRV
jgi:hypothetical protein